MCLPGGLYYIYNVGAKAYVVGVEDSDFQQLCSCPAIVTVSKDDKDLYSLTLESMSGSDSESPRTKTIAHVSVADSQHVIWTSAETHKWSLTAASSESRFLLSPIGNTLSQNPVYASASPAKNFGGILGCQIAVILSDEVTESAHWEFKTLDSASHLQEGIYHILNVDLGLYVLRETAASTEYPERAAVRVRHKDGRYNLSLETATPPNNPLNHPLEFFGIHTDSSGVRTVQWAPDSLKWLICAPEPGGANNERIYRIGPASGLGITRAELLTSEGNGVLGRSARVVIEQPLKTATGTRWKFEPIKTAGIQEVGVPELHGDLQVA